ncbi:MAG: hypothetical protein LBB63_00045 [Holosporaceae bacterium]|nr:hypothetical protein [Holosporaceae bacterium]
MVIEYILIVSLIVLVALGGMKGASSSLEGIFNKVGNIFSTDSSGTSGGGNQGTPGDSGTPGGGGGGGSDSGGGGGDGGGGSDSGGGGGSDWGGGGSYSGSDGGSDSGSYWGSDSGSYGGSDSSGGGGGGGDDDNGVGGGGSSSEEPWSGEYSWSEGDMSTVVQTPYLDYCHADIAYGGGVYMATGNGIFISRDGEDWYKVSDGYYYDVIYVNGVGFMITGESGKILRYNPETDKLEDMSISGGGTIRGITHADGMYVAVGDGGKVYTRGDGDTSWTLQTSGITNYLYDVAYADGKFTAVGDTGTIFTSDDGANWTQVPALGESGGTYTAVAAGGGIIVAVADEGEIVTCDSNGVWTALHTHKQTYFNDATYVDGVGFVIVGCEQNNWEAVIYISPDGINWIPQSVPDGVHDLRGITYVDGKFVTIGDNGEVIAVTPSL